MKDLWKTLRLAAYIFALPLVATAAVSGHQLFQNDDAVTVVATPKVENSEVELVGLSDTFRQHTISADENGDVSGRVWLVDAETKAKAGLADTKVFFVKDGDIASQVYTDPDGTFDASGLSEGAYSFIVSNVEGVAVYGVNIVKDGAAGDMEVVVVAKSASKAQELLDRKNELTTSESLTSEVVRGSNVGQLVDGQLEGQLYSTYENVDFTGSTVEIFNGAGKRVATTDTDAEGNFVVEELETGYYEFVASGPQGFAAFGFEAVGSNESYTSTQDYGFNAMVTNPADSYYVSDCASCSNSSVVYDSPVMSNSFVSSPVEYAGSCSSCAGAFSSCGGGCGCGGGGLFGGGGFGGAGLGRLLGIATLAVGITAIANDSSSDPGGATPSAN
jgi:hypothetical protein